MCYYEIGIARLGFGKPDEDHWSHLKETFKGKNEAKNKEEGKKPDFKGFRIFLDGRIQIGIYKKRK